MTSVACGECGAPMVMKTSRFGKFLGCRQFPTCKGTHSVHQDTGQPMGTPADKATKEARIKAHASFDTLWKSGVLTRQQAYKWMRQTMGLDGKTGHIGAFTKEQCVRLIALVEASR